MGNQDSPADSCGQLATIIPAMLNKPCCWALPAEHNLVSRAAKFCKQKRTANTKSSSAPRQAAGTSAICNPSPLFPPAISPAGLHPPSNQPHTNPVQGSLHTQQGTTCHPSAAQCRATCHAMPHVSHLSSPPPPHTAVTHCASTELFCRNL